MTAQHKTLAATIVSTCLVLASFSSPALAATPANTAPKARAVIGKPDPRTGAVLVRIRAKDADGDRLRYRAPGTTAKGTVGVRVRTTVSTSGVFTYTPTASARHAAASVQATPSDATDTFTVTVTDGFGGTARVPVTVSIAPQNSAPVATAPTVGQPDPSTGIVQGRVNASDPDGDPLTYQASVLPTMGNVVVGADGQFTYTPTSAARQTRGPAETTTDRFTIDITDGYGGSTSVIVVVSPVTLTYTMGPAGP